MFGFYLVKIKVSIHKPENQRDWEQKEKSVLSIWKQDFASLAAEGFTKQNHFAQVVFQVEDPYW